MSQYELSRHSELLPWRPVYTPSGWSVVLLVLTFLTCLTQLGAAQAVVFPPTSVGATSVPLAVPIITQHSGTVQQVQVVTQGVADLDFRMGTGANCSAGPINAGQSCIVSIEFQPTAPGGRAGSALLLDGAGNVLGQTLLSGVGLGSLVAFTPARINTVAGNGRWLFTGDGGLAVDSPIFLPGGVAVDPAGTIYLSDTGNNRIRRVTAGTITTVAGNGTPGYSGDNGPATLGSVSSPGGLALTAAGDLYIADTANHVIRMLVRATQQIITVAGTPNHLGYSGDGGPATSATLNAPEGVAVDAAGNLLIADTGNCSVRRVDTATLRISTIAGTGACGFSGDGGLATSAQLWTPWSLAVGADGTIFVADLSNNRVRAIDSTGMIRTVMGDGTATLPFDGQSGLSTSINNPAAVAVDVAGNLYVADSGHNVVRKLSSKTGISQVVAGDTSSTFGGDNSPATDAGLYGPYALTIDSAGNVYIADIFHHRIRELQVSQAALFYAPIRVGRTSATKQQAIENDGNAPLNWSSFSPDQNTAVNLSTTTCAIGNPIATDDSCSFGIQFSPQVTGAAVTSSFQGASDAGNSPAFITLQGEVDELEPTQTVLSASSNPVALGSPLTLTAQVSGDAIQPNGTIRFFDGSTLLGTASTNASGLASYSTSTLSLGSHSLTANFTGDVTNSPSTSSALLEVVRNAASVSLVSSSNPSKIGSSLSLAATVTSTGGQPTGSVLFLDGSIPIGSASITANGAATLSVSTLTAGNHSITASYAGDASTLAATSATLPQSIVLWPSATTISSSAATVEFGTPVQLSIKITSSSTAVPTGSVSLSDGTQILSTLTLDGNGSATYSTGPLATGTHPLIAAYLGDGTAAPSTSASLVLIVARVSTLTSLSVSSNPVRGGANLHLSAAVTPSNQVAAAGTLAGTVTFLDGTGVIGTANLSSAGIASLDTTTLSIGVHELSATYSATTNYDSSSSPAIATNVILANTSVQLSSSANPTVAGQAVTIAAIVSGNGAVPTGVVSFSDGESVIGTGKLNGAGQATLNLPQLSTGVHALTASYSGDSLDTGSVSSALNQVVSQASTSLNLISSSNPVAAGTALTFVATVSSNGSLPLGSILLKEGSQIVGTGTLNGGGSAQITVSQLPPGSHSIQATFVGDPDHSPAVSNVLVETVILAPSQIQLQSSSNPALLSDPVLFSVSVTGTGQTPTGSVVFHDGAEILGSVVLNSNGSAVLTTQNLAPGSHTISAFYAGDAYHAAAPAASIVERVQQPTIVAIAASQNPVLAGASVRLTASVTGPKVGSLTGTLTFTDGSAVLSTVPLNATGAAAFDTTSLSLGMHLITATYSGDDLNRGSTSSNLGLTVEAASTTLQLTSSANPSVVGGSLTLMARLLSSGNQPTGSVILLDGSSIVGSAPVNDGVAIFSSTSFSPGTHVLSAHFLGDAGTQGSTSAALLQVVQQTTSTSLISGANPILTLQPLTLTATVSASAPATGNVVFYDGSTLLGMSPLDGSNVATFSIPALPAGNHSLSAQYHGDTYSVSSSSGTVSESVQLRSTKTVVTTSAPAFLPGQQVTIVAVVQFTGPVTPSGEVTFLSSEQPLTTVPLSAAGAATMTFVPTSPSYNITAVYVGDSSYSPSTSSPFLIATGSSTTFSVESNPSSFDLSRGDHKTLTINLTGASNFSDTIALACLNLPADATCTFTSNQVALGSGASVSTQVVFDTGNPLGSGAAAQVAGSPDRLIRASVFLPLSVLFGTLLYVKRRRVGIPNLLAILLVSFFSLSLVGCGSNLNISKTPSGKYTIQVAARGMKSGVTQISNISVQVQ